MADPVSHRISCERSQDIVRAMNAVMPKLPRDVGDRLDKLKLRYLQLDDLEGLYQRVNNRTVEEILAHIAPGDDPTAIASGEVDGLRYELYDATPVDSGNDEDPNEQ